MRWLIFILLCLPVNLLAQSTLLTGIAAYYKLDESSGNAVDEVNANNGTITGATQGVAGKIGTAYSFNGNGDYIQLPDVAALQLTGSLTIDCWIYASSFSDNGSGDIAFIGGEVGAASLWADDEGYLLFVIIDVAASARSTVALTTGAWHHILTHFNTTTNSGGYYIDGVAAGTFVNSANVSAGASTNVIGRRRYDNTTSEYTGIIDEIGIWAKVLTIDEIAERYNSGAGLTYPFEAPPAGYTPTQYQPKYNGVSYIPKDNGVTYDMKYSYTSPSEPEESFTIYHEWDFNEESLGDYSSEVENDFDIIEGYWEQNLDIVSETIDGVTSNALRVRQAEDVMDQGIQLAISLGVDYEELYFTYNIKFASNWAWLEGKMLALTGFPQPPANYPVESDDGFISKTLFKEGGKMTTFYYEHGTEGKLYGAWGTEEYNTGNSVYFMNNVWYEVTQRLVLNTFTEGGTANADGLKEFWINGVKVFEETGKIFYEQENIAGLNGFEIDLFYSNEGNEPDAETYAYIDNIKLYVPIEDATLGTNTAHSNSAILQTPSAITNQSIAYDYLVTSAGTLSNSQYGGNYSNEIEEVYLIDAGAGNTVSYTFSGGHVHGDDFVIIRDGNQSVSEVLYRFDDGYPTGTFTSTGRYLSIQFTTQGVDVSTGFSGTVTFNEGESGYVDPKYYIGTGEDIETLAELNAIELTPGDSVMFNRGETFPGQLIPQTGVYYGAYGTGEDPVISGFQTLSTWDAGGTDIYRAYVNHDNLRLVEIDDTFFTTNFSEAAVNATLPAGTWYDEESQDYTGTISVPAYSYKFLYQ